MLGIPGAVTSGQERDAILDWLTPIDYDTQQRDYLRSQEPGTGQWILDSVEYRTWLERPAQTLFCQGMPGAGKTVLASVVVDSLITSIRRDSDVGVAYIYGNFRRQREQQADSLLASLLKQLTRGRSSMPDCVRALHGQHINTRTRPSLEGMSTTLQAVAAMYSRTFIVVDALDECQSSEGYPRRLITEILNLRDKSGANIFVTSRAIPGITKWFEGSIQLEICATREDVQTFLDSHLDQLPHFVHDNPELQDEIKTRIAQSVQGM